MYHQMRRYTVERGRLDDFIAEWEEHVAPLRRRFGFTVVAAWAVPELDEFTWILGHTDRETYLDTDRRYYDSEERSRIQPDPARFIIEKVELPATRMV